MQARRETNIAQDGDAQTRARLRTLTKLKPLYESVRMRLHQEKRMNMPVNELCAKLRTGSRSGEYLDVVEIRALLRELAALLPNWCTLATTSAGATPIDVLRTHRKNEIDPTTGRDRNHVILERAVEEEEKKLRGIIDTTTMTTTTTQPTPPATQVPNEEVQVKVEPTESSTAIPTNTADASSSSSPTVKVEVKSESGPSLSSSLHRASLLHSVASARLGLNSASVVPSSPSRIGGSMNNVSSRASAMVPRGIGHNLK